MDGMRKNLVFFAESGRYRHLTRGALSRSVVVNQQAIERAYDLLSRHKADWSLEQPLYLDPEIFDLEMTLFFKRHWLFAAMACEIPIPGAWLRVDIGRESVILVRRKDGG